MLENKYIELTKQFLEAIESGRSWSDLDDIRRQITELIIELDVTDNSSTRQNPAPK